MACLKLWRRFAEPVWLERARRPALHAADPVERARARYGQGRHSLWTGDPGVACVLWNGIVEDDRSPTLDHFQGRRRAWVGRATADPLNRA